MTAEMGVEKDEVVEVTVVVGMVEDGVVAGVDDEEGAGERPASSMAWSASA